MECYTPSQALLDWRLVVFGPEVCQAYDSFDRPYEHPQIAPNTSYLRRRHELLLRRLSAAPPTSHVRQRYDTYQKSLEGIRRLGVLAGEYREPWFVPFTYWRKVMQLVHESHRLRILIDLCVSKAYERLF